MIGIISKKNEIEIVKEFFQLFKTPWEFYNKDRYYNVVVSTDNEISHVNAKLLIIYDSEANSFDSREGITICHKQRKASLEYEGSEIPIYGNLSTLEGIGQSLIQVKGMSRPAGLEIRRFHGKIIRIGYDLFQEISFLLTTGQPIENAHFPTLELHILMLRDWIVGSGIPLVEVTPVPAGYDFIACLTHDVDFVKISNHKFDYTMWGFVYRAMAGSLFNVLKRNISWSRLLQNWKAVLSLPFVYIGLCRDFWIQFNRYLEIEKDLKSTFFFIPFKNRSGERVFSRYAYRRATRYDINDVRESAAHLARKGYEVGVHGIDAWHNAEKGRQELKRISTINGNSEIGIRMHWLCFDKDSPRILEEAGFYYDSTFGYNETIGYRGGTTQVFKPFNAENLLELPLHIQDVAMFSPGQMNLSENQAWYFCKMLFHNASIYGGVLTILWHLRSLAPERLWEDFYIRMLEELKVRRVWFGTAGQVIQWFRKRRSVTFKDVCFLGNKVRLTLKYGSNELNTALQLRVHLPVSTPDKSYKVNRRYIDIPWTGEREIEIPLAG